MSAAPQSRTDTQLRSDALHIITGEGEVPGQVIRDSQAKRVADVIALMESEKRRCGLDWPVNRPAAAAANRNARSRAARSLWQLSSFI